MQIEKKSEQIISTTRCPDIVCFAPLYHFPIHHHASSSIVLQVFCIWYDIGPLPAVQRFGGEGGGQTSKG